MAVVYSPLNGVNGNASTATKLKNARDISFSGAATGSFNFDGSGNSSCVLALANSGVVASTYGASLKIPVLTVNAKGLITEVSEQNIPIVDEQLQMMVVSPFQLGKGNNCRMKSFHYQAVNFQGNSRQNLQF
jgi:hypothetical protein